MQVVQIEMYSQLIQKSIQEQHGLKLVRANLFLTHVWLPNWEGGFYVDGEKFDFKPGSAVIFDSRQFHKGDQPKKEDTNWLRLTCNIIVER